MRAQLLGVARLEPLEVLGRVLAYSGFLSFIFRWYSATKPPSIAIYICTYCQYFDICTYNVLRSPHAVLVALNMDLRRPKTSLPPAC